MPGQGRRDRDADLRLLPATADAVTAALAADGRPATGHDRPLFADDLPAGLMYLCGPGAAAAARGLLVTAALASQAGTAVQISLRRRDLAALVPALDPGDPGPPGMVINDQVELPVGPPSAAADTGHAVCPAPELMLLIEQSGGQQADHPGPAASTRQTAVVVGGAATGPAWHVDTTGRTSGPGLTPPRRLCVLGPQAAADLIVLIRQSRGPTDTGAVRQRHGSRAHPPTRPTAGDRTRPGPGSDCSDAVS